jgi:ADP-ribose pyrophosphatase
MILEEKTVKSETVFSGKIFDIKVEKSQTGTNSELQHREVIIHGGGVTIVAEKDEKILLVKQYRYGAKQIMYELPAGKLNSAEEDILSAAKRELSEETGYAAREWKSLGHIYSSPAICSEKIYLFYARDLEAGIPHPDEGEIVEYEAIDKEKVFDMVKSGAICDAKTICGLMRAYKI